MAIADGVHDMKSLHRTLSLSGIALLVMIAGSCSTPAGSLAAEFHFVIHDVGGDAAAWSPREVVIHKGTDLETNLVFILENPTPRTHVFEAPGLFEEIVQGAGAPTVKPLRVYVTSGESVRVQVSPGPLQHGSGASASAAGSYQFFCPLHGPEEELRSTIRVVP